MPYSRDLYRVYEKMSDSDLRKLRGKKTLKLMKIQGYNSFFAKRDRAALQAQIDQIDAMLEYRLLRQKLT